MEELLELRAHIEQGRYAEALAWLGEMEEMSRDDKINKIESFLTRPRWWRRHDTYHLST
jgi:hypothetical protein